MKKTLTYGLYVYNIYIYTSTTAQGGGGSFKNRKPIYLFIYVSIYLCIYVSVYLCIYLSIYLSIHLSIYVSMYLCIYLSI